MEENKIETHNSDFNIMLNKIKEMSGEEIQSNLIRSYISNFNDIITSFNISFEEKSLKNISKNVENFFNNSFDFLIIDNEFYKEELDKLFNNITILNLNIHKLKYISNNEFINTFLLTLLERINFILITNFKINDNIIKLITNNINTHSSIIKRVINEDLIKIPYDVLFYYLQHINNFLTIDTIYLSEEKKYNTAKFVINEIISYCLVMYNTDMYKSDLNDYIKNKIQPNLTEELRDKIGEYIYMILIFRDVCIKQYGDEIVNEMSLKIINYFEESMESN